MNSRSRAAVQQDLDLVRLGQPFDVLVAVARQPDADLVLGVERERVPHHRAAAGPDRQILERLFLREVRRQDDRVAAGRANRTPHRQPADLPRRLDIPLQQRRRQIADRQVVEPVARFVIRQQRSRLDVEREQIADGVAVLGAIQAAEGVGAPGLGLAAAAWSSVSSSEATSVSYVCSSGRGSPAGGMYRARSLRTAFSQSAGRSAMWFGSSASPPDPGLLVMAAGAVLIDNGRRRLGTADTNRRKEHANNPTTRSQSVPPGAFIISRAKPLLRRLRRGPAN